MIKGKNMFGMFKKKPLEYKYGRENYLANPNIYCIRRHSSDSQPFYARTPSRSCFGQLADLWSDSFHKKRLEIRK